MEARMALLEEKFLVVGGSARMMFDYSTAGAMGLLRTAIAAVDDITQYLEGTVGCSSDKVVNRLLSWYPGASMDLSKPGILSNFVAREIGLRTGPEKLQALAKCLATNPAIDGWMFEMFFFSSLTNGGATILNEHRYHGGEIWTSSDVARFDPDREIRLDSPHQWLAPIKWNQGGYDAVFYEFKDLDNTECDRSAREAGFTMKIFVRIVQVTRSETHSFKVEYFKDLLSRFTALQPMWLYAVEVCFVVPSDVVSDFTLPVDKVTFRREGVEPAFYSVMVATDICIRVVALEYETWRPKKRLKRN